MQDWLFDLVMALWCAPLLKFFYVLFFPFLAALNVTTALLLRMVGLTDASGHEARTPRTSCGCCCTRPTCTGI